MDRRKMYRLFYLVKGWSVRDTHGFVPTPPVTYKRVTRVVSRRSTEVLPESNPVSVRLQTSHQRIRPRGHV